VLGKLEEVQRLLKHEEDYEYTQPCYWRAALLAVANARGTCADCNSDAACFIQEAAIFEVLTPADDFGCSLWEATTP
jgi:hypothetical protein